MMLLQHNQTTQGSSFSSRSQHYLTCPITPRCIHAPCDSVFFFLHEKKKWKVSQFNKSDTRSKLTRAHLTTPNRCGENHTPRHALQECFRLRQLHGGAPRVRGRQRGRLRKRSVNPTVSAKLVQPAGATTKSPASLWPWPADSRGT